MTIEKNTANANTGANASAAAKPQSVVGAYDLSKVGSGLYRRQVSRTNTSEVLARWEKAITAGLERHGLTDMGVLHLERDVDQIPISTIILTSVFAMQSRRGNDVITEDKVIAYSFFLEGSAEAMPDRTDSVMNIPVQIKLVPADLYCPAYIAKVRDLVIDAHGTDASAFVDGTFSVIPAEAAHDDEGIIANLLYFAENAIEQIALGMSTDENRFNVSRLPKSARVKASVSYNGDSASTACGLPVRSDISIVAYGTDNTSADQKSLVGGVTNQQLTRVDAFVEIQKIEPTQPTYGQQPINRCFKPVVVVSRIESLTSAQTLEFTLFGMSTLAVINDNRAWAAVFKSTAFKKEVDFKDIGAIGNKWAPLIGQPPVGKIDTRSNNFSDADFIGLISQAFEEYPVFALDVAKGDELNWLNSTFVVASNPQNPGYESARRAIIDAANALTNGNFNKHFNGSNEPLFVYSGNQVHSGYFTTDGGVRHDIRELDNLALENVYGVTDPATVLSWNQTFDNVGEPIELRLAKRYAILEAIAGKGLRLKDFVVRLYINNNFIRALIAACVDAGLHITPENVAQFYGQAAAVNPVLAAMGGGQFSAQLTQPQNAFSGNRGFTTGFSRFN